MNNKFAVLAFIALVSVFSVVSCGNDVPEESSVTLDLPVVTTSAETSAETTAAVTTVTVKTTVVSETSTAEETSTVTTEITTETATEATTEAVTEAVTEPPATEVPVTEPPTEIPATEPPVQIKFSLDNLNNSATNIIDSAGEPLEIQNATGCLANGADQRIYIYDGLQILCYINNDEPYIYQIMITNSSYCTADNITVGSSRSEVENVYGTGEELGNYVIYIYDNKELDVEYDGDTVKTVIFYMNL